MTAKRSKVVIHTDGGCDPNPGVGGWAAVLRYRDRVKAISGGESSSTNNRMELTAAIRALEALKRRCDVDLYTDSQYLRNGITKWIRSWKSRGWCGSSGGIKNLDLWQELDAIAQRHDITWHWIRGHDGNPDNELCDELAAREIEKLKRDA